MQIKQAEQAACLRATSRHQSTHCSNRTKHAHRQTLGLPVDRGKWEIHIASMQAHADALFLSFMQIGEAYLSFSIRKYEKNKASYIKLK
jgi:hypothetical protein